MMILSCRFSNATLHKTGGALMITGDGAYIKKINRGLILRKIIEEKSISRADLSKITGLNKATVSVQVSDLLDDHLIRETLLEHNFVGRRPIMLSINEHAGYVLGIDVDYQHIQFMVTDLNGQPVHSKTISFKTADYDEIASILTERILDYEQQYANSRYGLISANIGVHGTVTTDEVIQFVPTFQWRNKNLKADLEKHVSIPISVHNNANLSALAERVYHYQQSNHLLCIMLTSGIGVGHMVKGKIQTGFHGFAGEMGHMIVQQDGEQCNCGNRGCWELYSSEKSLFKKLKNQLQVDELSYANLQDLIEKEHDLVCAIIEQYIVDLSTGLNNLINLYNPETLVLTNAVLSMYPHAVEKLKLNLNSTVSHYGALELSTLGIQSCALGGCAFGIQEFLEIPEMALSLQKELPKSTIEKLELTVTL